MTFSALWKLSIIKSPSLKNWLFKNACMGIRFHYHLTKKNSLEIKFEKPRGLYQSGSKGRQGCWLLILQRTFGMSSRATTELFHQILEAEDSLLHTLSPLILKEKPSPAKERQEEQSKTIISSEFQTKWRIKASVDQRLSQIRKKKYLERQSKITISRKIGKTSRK